MNETILLILCVFALGFFIRSAAYFRKATRQNDEIIALLKDLRALNSRSGVRERGPVPRPGERVLRRKR
jgi:hypothetical protein